MLKDISIIIPVALGENALDILLKDLRHCGNEIIISSEGSRAKSLNAGAAKAKGAHLWFLHADSRITADNLVSLDQAIRFKPDALHYFQLAFEDGGLPSLNAWGANLRSRLFGTPYGDQGFCLPRSCFLDLGGYPEDVPYGEDLMFVWRARQAGIVLNPLSSTLKTSARKYKAHGWAKLTLLYQWRWIAMSLPEARKLLRRKN